MVPEHPLAVAESLLYGIQIARGLKHAETMRPGLVHRDIKPENVLLGADRLSGWPVGRARVTDFGLAAVCKLQCKLGALISLLTPPNGSKVSTGLPIYGT